MSDPKFAKAIDFMARDPKACKEFYLKHDPEFFKEFIEFFTKNMSHISGHMEKMAKNQTPPQEITRHKSKEEQDYEKE